MLVPGVSHDHNYAIFSTLTENICDKESNKIYSKKIKLEVLDACKSLTLFIISRQIFSTPLRHAVMHFGVVLTIAPCWDLQQCS